MKSLNEITEELFKDGQMCMVNLEIDALSYPVISKINNLTVEKYFIFSNQPKPVKERPYAWIIVDTQTGKLLSYNSCTLNDFAQSTGIVMNENIDYSVPAGGSFREILMLKQRFCNLYDKVRLFAFKDQLNKEEMETLKEYYNLHKKMFSTNVNILYRALSPDFYMWIENIL